MIIVSQDKETIINFDNITKIAQKDGKIGISSKACDSDYEEIGVYETEERAKEIMKEIIRARCNFEYYKYADKMERSEANLYMKNEYDFFDTYEMPEK